MQPVDGGESLRSGAPGVSFFVLCEIYRGAECTLHGREEMKILRVPAEAVLHAESLEVVFYGERRMTVSDFLVPQWDLLSHHTERDCSFSVSINC